MLIIENLVKNGNIIEADYRFPSQHDKVGHFKYDITKDEYIELKRGEEYEYGFSHIRHGIKDMIKYNKFPPKLRIYWY